MGCPKHRQRHRRPMIPNRSCGTDDEQTERYEDMTTTVRSNSDVTMLIKCCIYCLCNSCTLLAAAWFICLPHTFSPPPPSSSFLVPASRPGFLLSRESEALHSSSGLVFLWRGRDDRRRRIPAFRRTGVRSGLPPPRVSAARGPGRIPATTTT